MNCASKMASAMVRLEPETWRSKSEFEGLVTKAALGPPPSTQKNQPAPQDMLGTEWLSGKLCVLKTHLSGDSEQTNPFRANHKKTFGKGVARTHNCGAPYEKTRSLQPIVLHSRKCWWSSSRSLWKDCQSQTDTKVVFSWSKLIDLSHLS